MQQASALEEIRKLVTAKLKLEHKKDLTEEDHKYIKKMGLSIMSGKGIGKDTLAAWLIIWFMFCFDHCLVPCTAPSAHQLRDVLWKEVGQWLRRAIKIKETDRETILQRILELQSDKLIRKDAGKREWFAVARTASPMASAEEQATTLQGFHNRYMLIIADEASGIPDPVFASLDQTMTQPVNFMVVLFNPNKITGFAMETQSKLRDKWICLRWNAEDAPDWLVTRESLESKAKTYGKDSNHYRTSVLGLPPKAEEGSLIAYEWVSDAIDRDIIPLNEDKVVFSIDVGGGGDKSIILVRKGNKVLELLQNDTPDSEILVSWIMRKIFDWEPEVVFIDSMGMGWGIAGFLRQRAKDIRLVEVNVSNKAPDDYRFFRLRDELWWRTRQLFETGSISIPNDDELIAELTNLKFDDNHNNSGKIKIEGKRELRSRGLPSPNKADALMMSEFFGSDMTRKMSERIKNKKRENTSWRTV